MSMIVAGLRRAGVAVAIGTVLAWAMPGGGASAQQVDGARVIGVDDREVVVAVPLPVGEAPLDPASLSASVGIGDISIPAEVTRPRTDARQQVAVLVMDASGSMAGASMRAARDAASAYLDALPADVLVGLVTFADDPRIDARPGATDDEVREALAQVRPQGDTSLYDGVRTAVGLIPAGAEGRLLVLTDGEDTSSATTLMGAARAARAGDVAVDVVLLDPSPARRAVLRELAVTGRVTSATDAASLTRSFVDAAIALNPQYVVRFRVPESMDSAPTSAFVTVRSATGELSATVDLPDIGGGGESSDEPAPTPTPSGAAAPPVDQQGLTVVGPGAPTGSVSWGVAVIAAAAVGILVLALAWSAWQLRAESRRRRRISQVMSYGSGHGRGGSVPRSAVLPWLSHVEDRLGSTRVGRGLRARLEAAELSLSPAAWLGLLVGGALLTIILGWLLLDVPWLALLLGLTVVPLGFLALLRWRVERRQRAFSDELPEFLLLLSSALRAGLSFTQALSSAADQQRGQVGRQIRRALAEAQLSANLDEALLSCADRMGSEDLRWAVTALSVQREVGGNLSVILDNTAATIKGRHALAREVRALSAEGRLSAYVLIALPIGVFAFLTLFRREYISRLWSNPLGITMMIALVILMVVGWLWMRAVVRIRV